MSTELQNIPHALACGCYTVSSVKANEMVVRWSPSFCPMHAAAPELLVACKLALLAPSDVETERLLRLAIALAEAKS